MVYESAANHQMMRDRTNDALMYLCIYFVFCCIFNVFLDYVFLGVWSAARHRVAGPDAPRAHQERGGETQNMPGRQAGGHASSMAWALLYIKNTKQIQRKYKENSFVRSTFNEQLNI